MPHASSQAFSDHLQTLFGAGTCAGLTDGELIERFRAAQDEGSEQAFEALVTRHGPMVMGVCRNILRDPVDLHDAFQATFLVLARRADAIRNRDVLASWLYGVAIRVAARGRALSIRRQIRNRRSIAAAGSSAVALHEPSSAEFIERNDAAAMVHQEVNRLPEKYRAPIVLCYLEGLTHDEAAARLRWPIGTVRSRLSRARDRLRSRLTRRGITAPPTLGALAGFFPGDAHASIAAAASPLPAHLATSVARLATRFAIGQSATAGSLPAAALGLAQGVLSTMILKKLTIAGCVILSLGIATAGGGALLIRTSRAQDPKPGPAGTQPPTTKLSAVQAAKPADIDPKLEELLAAAKQRFEAQRAYYEEGRITIDRFIDSLERLEKVQLIAAKTDAERIEIRQRHLTLLAEVENRENAELKVGRGTTADVSEARQRHLEAEYEFQNINKEAAEKSAILRRLSELERKVDGLQRHQIEKPQGTR
jgi:RNA polymerase sigma factor (sigma-70 family)